MDQLPSLPNNGKQHHLYNNQSCGGRNLLSNQEVHSGSGSRVADAAADHQAQAPLWYEAFSVTDWRYSGLDAVDFGSGAPARVLWHAKRIMERGCVVCPPRRDGGLDLSTVFVKPEHVDAFLGELARLAASAE